MALAFTLVDYGHHQLAWCDDWPGMLAGGTNRAEVEAALPRSIAEYAAWLARSGEDSPAGQPWFIREVIDGSEAPGGDICSDADRRPLFPGELDRFLRHAAAAAADLAASTDLPSELLDWAPAGLELVRTDPWAPDVRTIRGIVTHALQLEVFYRSSLDDGVAPGIFEPVAAVMDEHDRTAAVLRAANPGRVFRPSHAGGPPEEWTVRKVLRRLISHHRGHAAEIRQRETWVLLGQPKSY